MPRRRGVSRIYLSKLPDPPATILEFLCARFPHVTRATWLDRIDRELVRTAGGRRVTPTTPYAHGLTVVYERESPDEPHVPFAEAIVHRDERIIVADKPHFLPVVPGGPYVVESLLARLVRSTGLASLAPAHRIDRDTAGLVLFAVEQRHRAPYHRLFADDAVEKEYEAIAHAPRDPEERTWLVENRLGAGDPWFRQTIVDGEPNATTRVELLEWRDGRGRFRIVPRSGRKHQIRVHMASLGFPVVDDPLYPDVREIGAGDFSRPMRLLARRLAFTDPITGERLRFESSRHLALE